MIKAIWVNGDSLRPTCSVYESGICFHEALTNSKYMDIDYINIPNLADIEIPNLESYDLAIFNYTRNNFFYVPVEHYSRAKKNMVFTGDSYYASPWAFWATFNPQEIFDYVGIPDPTIDDDDPRVLVMPRCCPRTNFLDRLVNTKNPIISTYGFPNLYKTFDNIVMQMNEEFDTGLLRLHFPSADPLHPREQLIMKDEVEKCKKAAKQGIEIEYSNDYKDRENIIAWLNQSDANVFINAEKRFYETGGAIPMGTDWAISAQRPIIIAATGEMRHIFDRIPIFPDKNFTEIMETGIEPIKQLYNEWSPINCAITFDKFLEEKDLIK